MSSYDDLSNDTHAAWLVDLDGTLYHSAPLKLAMAAEVALGGAGALRTLRRFREAHEQLRTRRATTDPFEAQLLMTAQSLGCSTGQVERIVREWMIRRPCPWIARFRRRALLRAVADHRARGGKAALVSDYPATEKLEALGAASLFDVVVASGEPGGPAALKPDPAGYLLARDALGVGSDRCLVIGDRDDADGAAARAAGMTFRRVGW